MITSTKSLTLKQRVRCYEAAVIRRALIAANGSVSRAARDLGTDHQNLCNILNTRHQELLPFRTPITTRRKSTLKIK